MIRGTRILMGDEAVDYRQTIDQLCGVAMKAGYQEVVIPSLWEQKTFIDKAGEEVCGQMYAFQDKKKRNICLIPEVTAIIQEQYKNEWSKSLPKPVRVFYVQRCYRYEKPQKGRYREFTQFGVECLGDDGDPRSTQLMKGLLSRMLATVLVSGWKVRDGVTRGLNYYTEDGFEAEVDLLGKQKQVAGGGRYAEGVGFAIGIDRLLLARQLSSDGR